MKRLLALFLAFAVNAYGATAIPNIFATQPSGNVPASYLDTDFALISNYNTFSNYLVDTGAANAYVVTFPAGTTGSLAAGLLINFKAGAANTGASTLAVNGMTAKNITNYDASALAAGQIKAGAIVSVIYDGTQFKLAGQPGGVSPSFLTPQATNTVLGNATSGSAAPTALAVGTCSGATKALIWTTNTGFGCNTSITAAAVPVGGITGLGTGVGTALAVNVGSAGAPVLFNGAGGTPSSITLTNAGGTAASLTAGAATTATNFNNGTSSSSGGTVTATTFSGALSGNASTATTATNFNNGTSSSSGGTVTATTFSGALTGNVTGNVTGSSGSTTGNAATATKLATARTIGGVSFDGSANINLPGVNTTGNQNTSGNAATATTAGTVTTAAQPAITSVGALTGGSIGSGFGAINIGSNSLTAGAGSFTAGTFSGANGIVSLVSAASGTNGSPIYQVFYRADGTTRRGYFGFASDDSPVMTIRNDTDSNVNIIIGSAVHTFSSTGLAVTGTTSSTAFSGPLTGNVTGNVSGSSGSTTGNAATATTATNFNNGTSSSSGGTVTATTFSGALTGNVTGNVSGTAATVTGAAQSAITSVGTLTGLSSSSYKDGAGNLIISSTAPTIASGFGTSPSIIAHNTAAFAITVGSGGTAYTGTITLPTAADGWVCKVGENSAVWITEQYAMTTTSVSVQNIALAGTGAVPWSAGIVLYFQCTAF